MSQDAATPAGTPGTIRWYALPTDEVLHRFSLSPTGGLTADRAAALLEKNGPNALPTEKPEPGWRRFLDQYRSYMQIILLLAGIVSLVIQEMSTGILLLILTVLNAVVGLREEGKAASAMNALKSMLKESAKVKRDGQAVEVPADEVVPGDLVMLAAGDQVPADGRVIEASALQIDESALTGESTPVAIGTGELADQDLPAADQTNMAFMNTPVTHGSGTMVVTATGGDTQVGRIAGLLTTKGQATTPLQRQLNRMTIWIGVAALVTMIVMVAFGLSEGVSGRTLFVTAVALAIAAIPEALPTVVEVILSLGAVDLAKRKAIVKDLTSVETLGSTSAINSDKTGTLTMNQMTVVEVVDAGDRYSVSGIGYELAGSVQHPVGAARSIDAAILPLIVANDAQLKDGQVVGDPTEGAFLVLAHKAGLNIAGTRDKFPRIATLPFDPTYKFMATFNKATDSSGKEVVRCFVKGAAPAVHARATSALSGETPVPFTDELLARGQEIVDRMEGDGLRVMIAAVRDIDPDEFDPRADLLGYVDQLQITSLVGMIDPPRDSSKAAVAAAQAAHIRVRMITGDDVTTGAAIAKQLGIPGTAILGSDFAALSPQDRLAKVDEIGVVGRVAPEHKAMLVETLKQKGEVVAMTGDGVNDAPAIKAADIGIAMGTGTEVAKSAGRMILSDDNFATIVFAIEQGRKLYDNLTKYVRFILITLVAFVLTFLGSSLLNIAAGQPFSPTQILWINFLIDTPLGIALGFDKETPGLMLRKPRSRAATILTTETLISAILPGIFMAVMLLSLIRRGEMTHGSVTIGVSMALTAFAFFRIVSAFQTRSATDSTFTVATFDCRQLNYIVLAEVVLSFLVTQWSVMNDLLNTTPLTGTQWLVSVAPAIELFLFWEIGKLIARKVGVGQAQPESAG